MWGHRAAGQTQPPRSAGLHLPEGPGLRCRRPERQLPPWRDAGREQLRLRHRDPLHPTGRAGPSHDLHTGREEPPVLWSFVHIADAAEATVAAVENGGRGVYNIVDDEPAPVAVWLPALAEMLGAKKPMRVPRFIGRLAAGQTGVVLMTELRGATNAKAKRDLGWHPAHPSWRQGLQG